MKPAISSRATLPVLNGIQFDAADNELTLTTTDLNLGIKSKLQCSTHREGAVVIPQDIISIVDKLDKESNIVIETDENNISNIKYGNSEVNLHGFNAEEFPQLPEVEGKEYTLNIEPVKVTFACSTEDHRPVFTGTLLDMDNGYIVATDTHRMVVNNIEKLESGGQAVIPAQFMRMMNPGNKLVIGDTQTKAIDGDIEYFTRNLKGQFPNWQMAIPGEFPTEIKVNTKEFKGAVQRTQFLSNNTIVLSIKDTLQVKARSEKGNINEVVDCITVKGNEIEAGFNSKYIFEGLKQVDAEEVTLKLSGSGTPAVMQGESDDWLYLIVPAQPGALEG